MVDPVAIGAIILSTLTALAGLVTALHIKRMKSGCCECVSSNSPPNSPLQRQSTDTIYPHIRQPQLKSDV